MSPLLILIIGLIVVLGGILVVKLHPILSLLSVRLIVGLLTTNELLFKYAADKGMSEQATKTFLNQSLGERVAIWLGDTCQKVGLLIVLGIHHRKVFAGQRSCRENCSNNAFSFW
jgi:GntP family gluconate:H+ symporter